MVAEVGVVVVVAERSAAASERQMSTSGAVGVVEAVTGCCSVPAAVCSGVRQ